MLLLKTVLKFQVLPLTTYRNTVRQLTLYPACHPPPLSCMSPPPLIMSPPPLISPAVLKTPNKDWTNHKH